MNAPMMSTQSIARWLAIAALVASIGAQPAQAQPQSNDVAHTIVVGNMRVPPFVLRGDDGEWSGLSIDLWKEIAADLKTSYEFREYDYDAAGLLQAVERGQIDAALAIVPVTVEGEHRFDFSHAYFTGGLGIAVRAEPVQGMWATLRAVMPRLVIAIGGVLGGLLLVGTLMWLLERRHNAQHFAESPARGIADGLWWAAVTMTTTGYGDKVPVSVRGRLLGLLWMFASIFMIAFFSATMASSFVVTRLKTGITSPEDLARARIAVVSGTAGQQWAAAQGLEARTYPYVIHASKALQRGDVEALVHERAILGHMIKQYGWHELQLLPHTLAVHDFAIVLPVGSPLREAVNRALLKVVQRPDWTAVVERYVGPVAPAAADR